MDYAKILKRSWETVRRHRALWVFGALLALTTTNAFFLGYGFDRDDMAARNMIRVAEDRTFYFPGEGVSIDLTGSGDPVFRFEDGDLRDLFGTPIWRDIRAILITSGVVLAGIVILRLVTRYVAEAALIRMVDESERSSERLSVKRGLRLGWSRSAWRLFMIDLVIHVPLGLVLTLSFVLALAPLLLWTTESWLVGTGGTLLSLVLLALFGLASFIVSIVLSPLRPVIRRVCAVEGLGIGASIKQGLSLVGHRLGEILAVWLIWLGIRLGWAVAMVPVVILLFPATVAFILAGLVLGGLPAATIGGLLSLSFQGVTPWIIGTLVGLPIFILVASAPIVFVSGLAEVYLSALWTLAYREIRRAREVSVAAIVPPRPAPLQPAQAV